jgi:imidazolonepropionase-like amidohydrolase
MIDVRNGREIVDPVVVIQGDRIVAAGANVAVPAGARVIELPGLTLLPGLIDAHTHLLHQYYREFGPDEVNTLVEIARLGAARRALLGAKNARDMLEAGVTTVRDLGNSGINNDVALRTAINDGLVPGPRMFVSTRAISPLGGQLPNPLNPSPDVQRLIEQEYVQIVGVEEARRAVREAIVSGADLIKVIVNTGTESRPVRLRAEEMKVIVEEAHRAGLRVAAHATQGDSAAMLAAEAGVNSIEHAYTVSSAVLNLMARKNIYLVPTDAPGVERYEQRVRRAINAGVKIAIGSDQYYFDPNKNRGQSRGYGGYVKAGMSPLQVIQAATLHAADLVWSSGEIGVLEPGRLADIIATSGDPLKDITALERINFVMKGGTVVKAPTRMLTER